MDTQEGPAAPASGNHNIPTFEELAADPEIAPLLEFEPVPRKFEREDGWTPALQRRFIAHLARTGSPGKACDALGKRRSGIDKLSKLAGSDSFREAWAKAVELAAERKAAQIEADHAATAGIRMPFVDHRHKHPAAPHRTDLDFNGNAPLPGQLMNEHGEWEHEESLARRAEDARDSISEKLLRCRRLYLAEISTSAAKRAAFEILTLLPIDWDKARNLEPQDDEPWRKPNMRRPDMLLAAENGWLGDIAHGPDKITELRRAIDEHRAEQGLEPVDWSESAESSEQAVR